MSGGHRLPDFSLASYAALLDDLVASGYAPAPVSAMPAWAGEQVVYLRHDIDLHVPGIEKMARTEQAAGASATYFVMASQHYNPWYPANARVLREVAGMGHEIGLHYDLSDYPDDEGAARERLSAELASISALVGRDVRCISMHQPHLGHADLFRHGSGLVHPHDETLQAELLYVSDSCRAWRDESLLRCFEPEPPRRLHLLTHPELWLDGTIRDRQEYLTRVLLPNVVRQQEQFVLDTVRTTWLHHEGARAHDEREGLPAAAPAIALPASGSAPTTVDTEGSHA